MMNTIKAALAEYAQRHDFNKPIGTIAKFNAVKGLAEHFENPKLRIELDKCSNLTQMANTIEQITGALTKERTPEELQKFKTGFERLIKLAGL